jgi:hypothetical protein
MKVGLLRLQAAIGLATLGLPAVASAVEFKKIETAGFTVMLPGDWTLATERHYDLNEHHGRWVYSSPNKNLHFRVNIEKDTGGDFAKMAEDAYQRIRAKISGPELKHKEVTKHEGNDIAFYIFTAKSVRKDYMHEYLYVRMTMRDAAEKRLVTATFASTGERVDLLEQLGGKIIESFVLAKPKVPVHKQPIDHIIQQHHQVQKKK